MKWDYDDDGFGKLIHKKKIFFLVIYSYFDKCKQIIYSKHKKNFKFQFETSKSFVQVEILNLFAKSVTFITANFVKRSDCVLITTRRESLKLESLR